MDDDFTPPAPPKRYSVSVFAPGAEYTAPSGATWTWTGEAWRRKKEAPESEQRATLPLMSHMTCIVLPCHLDDNQVSLVRRGGAVVIDGSPMDVESVRRYDTGGTNEEPRTTIIGRVWVPE